MKDTQLREAFRSLVRHLNLKVKEVCYGDYYDEYNIYTYTTHNYPAESSCNVARRGDIRFLQEQIDELKQSKRKETRKK